jgi:hypothetical protein
MQEFGQADQGGFVLGAPKGGAQAEAVGEAPSGAVPGLVLASDAGQGAPKSMGR